MNTTLWGSSTLAACLVLTLVGCSSSESDDSAGAAGGANAPTGTGGGDSGAAADGGDPLRARTGSIVLRFQLGGSAGTSRNLVDPLEGPVYGSIFSTEDVTLTGPTDTAEAVVSVRVDSVDLRERDVSESTFEADLPPGDHTFLGFWDIDHSSSPDDPAGLGPENGDPVPLADTNQFTVVADATTEVTATFELIYAFD